MKTILILLGGLTFFGFFSLQAQEIFPSSQRHFKSMPTVPESQLPELSNQTEGFKGSIKRSDFWGYTYVKFPFVENPGSFGFDRQGRLYVAEANRFWAGVPDLRGANPMIPGDFQIESVQDRLDLYDKFKANFPPNWFSTVPDRIIRLEDRDNNRAADHRTLFSDHFKQAAHGIGFSVLADEDNTVYFTCIPSVWKITDSNDDGIADKHEEIATGFGSRISFIGHDLHGIIRGPDGMLYFSVGDRGYQITDANGKVQTGPGKGAIFRCESDGSGLEVYCTGLRNPQELAFDQHGNLFTFDNTGDIGDKARFVYALYGTDSGWDMAHQSPHQYVKALDWGDFHPETAMWVAEKLFEPYSEAQAQWVYPPASNVTKGPSGITYLTGETIPSDLVNKFLVSDYQGTPYKSKTWIITHKRNGAGFIADTNTPTLIEGIANSDVELGFDGKLYFCDFGGGWSINTNGSIQVIESTDPEKVKAGAAVANLFKQGFRGRSISDLKTLLSHRDIRVRQTAHLEMTNTPEGADELALVASNQSLSEIPRLHAIWGLGKICRTTGGQKQALIALLNDPKEEIRANVVRVLGDCRVTEAASAVSQALIDDSSVRVRALSAIALGRLAAPGGDSTIAEKLYQTAKQNTPFDVVVRHAVLSGLDTLGTEAQALAKVTSSSEEERMTAVLFLRRKQSSQLTAFLSDPSLRIRSEVIRAIYDTKAMDTEAGKMIAQVDPSDYPRTVQRRIMAANYRLGGLDNAKALINIANNDACHPTVRKAAFQGLLKWENLPITDPVHGTYRPVPNKNRSFAELKQAKTELIKFVTGNHDSALISLGMNLAGKAGVNLDSSSLAAQVTNTQAPVDVRIASLNSLVKSQPNEANNVINAILTGDEQPPAALQAKALSLAYQMGWSDWTAYSTSAIEKAPIEVARVAVKELSKRNPAGWTTLFNQLEDKFRPELKLDAYLALKQTNPDAAANYLKKMGDNALFKIGAHGGDITKGEKVYLNQGGCGQCHQVGSQGQGVQGPNLAGVASRLNHDQLSTSLYDPNAEIAEGYGLASVTKNDSTVVTGRLTKQTAEEVVITGLDGVVTALKAGDVQQIVNFPSAMPNIVAALPPEDYRDLVAYLASLTEEQARKASKVSDGESHGDPDEAVSK